MVARVDEGRYGTTDAAWNLVSTGYIERSEKTSEPCLPAGSGGIKGNDKVNQIIIDKAGFFKVHSLT